LIAFVNKTKHQLQFSLHTIAKYAKSITLDNYETY